MATIAFTLIGHNEAHNLPRCLESVRWADEIVYVDCESTDGSLEVAQRYTSRLHRRPNLKNLNVNKQFAIDQATADWVFYLDPDEVIPPALGEELRRVIAATPPENAFKLPRRNLFFGRWLRHGRLYPDTQLRLFRRTKARFPCRDVHERLEVDGRVGRLREDMLHHTSNTPADAIRKLNFNTDFYAEQMAQDGVRPTLALGIRYLLLTPLRRILSGYVLKGGFRDGWPGLYLAGIDAFGYFVLYFKLWHASSALNGGRKR